MTEPKTKIMLKELDWDDPLRNTPLKELNVFHRYNGEKTWRHIHPSYRIGGCTFNELGRAWTFYSDWAIM